MPETADFGMFRQFEETPVEQMSNDMKEAYDFMVRLLEEIGNGRRADCAKS